MRFYRSLPWLLFPLVALAAPALAQNLLVNPGFDRDLGGWTAATTISPDPSPVPGYVEASLGWTPSDAAASAFPGGATLHARANTMSAAKAALSQCVPVSERMLISFGAKILTVRQYMTAQAAATVSFFSSTDCSGTLSGGATAASLPVVIGLAERNSGGLWLPVASQAVSSGGTRSVLFGIGVSATGTMAYGLSYVDAVADDVVLTAGSTPLTTWLLPSAAWVHGAGGSYWTTRFTLCNPGPTDAVVTFKWLGHGVDGRGGPETAYVVHAGQTFVPDENTWSVNHPEDYGAILVTSSSSALVVQSETSTPSSGGTVGQALPAFGPADFAGATPKAIAPVRENAAFRTNLVLTNAVAFPVTAHVVLFDADGTPIGTRDVDLPPLGMTQINHVAVALGAPTLDLGRIAVSTPTPGGLIAAYASVIDNVRNDPRTILPR